MPTLAKKVFLSSTFIDLKEYREAAIYACQRVGLLPVYMEDFPPDPRNAVAVCKAKVDEADLFLGLYAHRYGYVPNGSKVSITEMEYEWARERKLPPFLFIIDPDYPWPPAKVDKGTSYKRLERFKTRIGKQHLLRKFRDTQTLKEDILLLGTELAQAKLETPTFRDSKPPSSRRVLPPPPEMHSMPPYILTTRFVGRRRDLDTLDAWACSVDPIQVIEAIGGVGKSALTWEWARERAPYAVKGHAGTLWWSFYEGGASTDSFIRETLAYVTKADPEELRSVLQAEQVQRLFSELQRLPYLIVLDGFERLLTAYHQLDPSKLRDDQVEADHRACTNPRTHDLIRVLKTCSPSKVLLTTRLMPSALENPGHQPLPGVRLLKLRGLDPADGENLLRELGVHGTSSTIRHFLHQFDNHSLLISAIAGRIAEFRQAPGDFDAWYAHPEEGGSLRLSELDLKQRRTHILAYSLKDLHPKTRQLLSRIAVLSDAADYAALSVLNPYLPSPPEGVTRPEDLETKMLNDLTRSEIRRALRDPTRGFWRRIRLNRQLQLQNAYLRKEHEEAQIIYNAYKTRLGKYFDSADYRAAIAAFDAALSNLENRSLLYWDRQNNTYDMHPVVRGYAFDKLEASDRSETYDRVRDHFESLPPENPEDATELSDLRNTVQIYRALVGASKLDLAADIYRNRLGQALLFSVSSLPTIVELLTPLFRSGIEEPPALTSIRDQGYVTNNLSIALDLLGRRQEALKVSELAMRIHFGARDWFNLSTVLSNYAGFLKSLNKLAASFRAIDLAEELCLSAGSENTLTAISLDRMNLFLSEGRWGEAQVAYEKFTSRPTPYRSHYRRGGAETQICWLKLMQGLLQAKDVDTALQSAKQAGNLFQLSEIHRIQAEFALLHGELSEAVEKSEQAIEIARKTGSQVKHYQGTLARALAQQGLHKEARRLIEDSGCHDWQAAQVYLDVGDSIEAGQLALQCYRAAWADGPPHSWWWELERSREILRHLKIPEPQLATFDPSKIASVPLESAIRSIIEEREEARSGRGR